MYLYAIQIPFFASQRANASANVLFHNPDRDAVLDYLQETEYQGFTFLLKKTPVNVGLKTLSDIMHVPDMRIEMIKGNIAEQHFSGSKPDTPEAKIWRVIQVSDAMLSKGMGKRSKPL